MSGETNSTASSVSGELKKWTRLKMAGQAIGLNMIDRGNRLLWRANQQDQQRRNRHLDNLLNDRGGASEGEQMDDEMRLDLGDSIHNGVDVKDLLSLMNAARVPEQRPPQKTLLGQMVPLILTAFMGAGGVLGVQGLMQARDVVDSGLSVTQQRPTFTLVHPDEIIEAKPSTE